MSKHFQNSNRIKNPNKFSIPAAAAMIKTIQSSNNNTVDTPIKIASKFHETKSP